MKQIIVTNRKTALSMADMIEYVDWNLISIESPNQTYKDDPANYYQGDILKLKFHDLTKEYAVLEKQPVLMDENQAKQIIDFIQKNAGQNFIIHCCAGVSRSVAVASFMRDFMGYNVKYTEVHDDQFRNVHVYNMLKKVYEGDKEWDEIFKNVSDK